MIRTLACETRACARRSNNNNDRDAETAGDNLAGVSLGRVGRHTRENGRVAFSGHAAIFSSKKREITAGCRSDREWFCLRFFTKIGPLGLDNDYHDRGQPIVSSRKVNSQLDAHPENY